MATSLFPTLRPADTTPLAVIEGRVELRGKCLWFVTDQGTYLALWPPGARLQGEAAAIAIHDAAGRRLATLGTRIRAVGGELPDPRSVMEVTGQEPPQECRVGRSWRAYEVTAIE